MSNKYQCSITIYKTEKIKSKNVDCWECGERVMIGIVFCGQNLIWNFFF